MRKISIGDKVIFEKSSYGLVEGIVIDIKYIPGPWREYAVRSKYINGFRGDGTSIEHVEWFWKGDLVRAVNFR